MIEIHINPARVERIVLSSMSECEDDFTHAAWVAIRPLVRLIDRRLQTLAQQVIQGETESIGRPGRAGRGGGKSPV